MSDIFYAVAHRSQEEIDSFKTRYEDFPTDRIPEIFKSALNLTVTHFEKCQSFGTAHVIYYVSVSEEPIEFILRSNLGFSDPEVVMMTEKLVTDRVSELGVPVNTIRFTDVSRKKFSFDFQIQECLIGQDIEMYFHGTKEEYDRLSYELGEYVARFHALEFDGFGRFDEKCALEGKLSGTKKSFSEYIDVCLESDCAYLVKDNVIDKFTAKEIIKVFEERKNIMDIDKGVLIHHDLADHNIMFSGNHITGIFDWEACVVGDPALDLASCPTWRTHHPREDELLKGYASVKSLPKHFEEKRNLYLLRTMLWKMVLAIRSGMQNKERTQKFSDTLAPYGLTVKF
ncbi:aminoglycoside phosphotransferase family protein [Candidatus Gottesmanbacteria bacterium]|nr:aminoglycoside phosphotransferase family protein [Candidatus Gottesmanbacteria bacterium]